MHVQQAIFSWKHSAVVQDCFVKVPSNYGGRYPLTSCSWKLTQKRERRGFLLISYPCHLLHRTSTEPGHKTAETLLLMLNMSDTLSSNSTKDTPIGPVDSSIHQSPDYTDVNNAQAGVVIGGCLVGVIVLVFLAWVVYRVHCAKSVEKRMPLSGWTPTHARRSKILRSTQCATLSQKRTATAYMRDIELQTIDEELRKV